MKLIYKLTFGFLMISLLVIMQAYLGYNGANSLEEQYTLVSNETLPVIESLNAIRFSGIKVVESTNEILKSSPNNTDYIDFKKIEIAEYSSLYNESMEIYTSRVDTYFPDEIDFLNDTKANMQDILRLSSELIYLKENGNNKSQINEKELEFAKSEEEFITTISIALDHEKDELKERTEETENVIENLKSNSLTFGVFSFFLALILGYIFSHRISRPIIKLKNASSQISCGNLDTKIDIKSNDEIEDLGHAFIGMVHNLRKSHDETTLAIAEQKRLNEQITRSLNEKELLLREIHHRVKNNLQIVTSLLNLQSQNIEDDKFKNIFMESQNRIHAMALIHEKLYQSVSLAEINFKEYVTGIVTNIIESYGQKMNIKFDINIKEILLNIDYAVPCGLIINEILTNSFKYAFPDGRQGIITILVESTDNNMHILIRDNGIGIPKDLDIRNTTSLGLRLITGLAEGQLHGEIILNRENGTEFQINFRQAK